MFDYTSNYGSLGITLLAFVFSILSLYRVMWFADALLRMFNRRI